MKSRVMILMLASIFLATDSLAGVKDLTWHSRANCGNNESISWHLAHTHTLLTVSDHLRHGKVLHSLATGWEDTWRSANVHWGEGDPMGGWHVQAGHYLRVGDQEYRLGFTEADNCNIYDGWWDH